MGDTLLLSCYYYYWLQTIKTGKLNEIKYQPYNINVKQDKGKQAAAARNSS